ncbi:MAG TPA: hypothetical protein VNP03_12440, partial [Pseudonocardia sp.]|nr:hypothetical protein [Pseudonocardia sp.]
MRASNSAEAAGPESSLPLRALLERAPAVEAPGSELIAAVDTAEGTEVGATADPAVTVGVVGGVVRGVVRGVVEGPAGVVAVPVVE